MLEFQILKIQSERIDGSKKKTFKICTSIEFLFQWYANENGQFNELWLKCDILNFGSLNLKLSKMNSWEYNYTWNSLRSVRTFMLLVNMKLIVIYVHFTNQSNESMGHLKCLCNLTDSGSRRWYQFKFNNC